MSKLIDHLSDRNYRELEDQFDTAVQLRMDTSEDDRKDNSTTLMMVNTATDQEVGETMVRYAYEIVKAHSKPSNSATWDYYYRGYFGEHLRDKFREYGNVKQADMSISSIISQLKSNGYLHKISQTEYLLREWPQGKPLRLVSPWSRNARNKPDPREEKRIIQMSDQPVKESVDPKAIPFPKEITPEALVEYVGKVANSLKKLDAKYEESQKSVERLTRENRELKDKLEKVSSSEWDMAAARIKDMIGS